MAFRRGGQNRARQKSWPGDDAAKIREEKRGGWPSIVRSRLEEAGADVGLAETICTHAKFGKLRGVDPEDLLQEAIVASLSGESPTTGMVRIMNQGRYEAPVEAFLSEDGQRDIWNVIEDQFDRQSDNDRPDWIPNDPAERARLIDDCLAAIDRADMPRAMERGQFHAVLSLRGVQKKVGRFDTDKARARAEKIALNKIIWWCSPIDELSATSKKQPAELVKWSNFWSSYKRHTVDGALDLIAAREEFLGVPAALWRKAA